MFFFCNKATVVRISLIPLWITNSVTLIQDLNFLVAACSPSYWLMGLMEIINSIFNCTQNKKRELTNIDEHKTDIIKLFINVEVRNVERFGFYDQKMVNAYLLSSVYYIF